MVEPIAPVSAPSVDDGAALQINDITCPITQGVFIEPYKTNCGHLVEKLALAKLLRDYDCRCPVCRAVVSSAVADEELTKKIQDQFVKIHGTVNEANKRLFDEQKKSMDEEPLYDSVRAERVVPLDRATRRVEIPSYAEVLRGLIDPRDTVIPRADYSDPRDTVIPRADYSDPRDTIIPRADYSDNRDSRAQVQLSISTDNLFNAERIADRIHSTTQKNLNYNNIASAYIIKVDFDASNIETHLDNAIRVTSKISVSYIKNDLFSRIALKYLNHKKYSKALEIGKKIDSLVLKFLNLLRLFAGVVMHGFDSSLNFVLLPFRIFRERWRH